jgi:hypothetical protein
MNEENSCYKVTKSVVLELGIREPAPGSDLHLVRVLEQITESFHQYPSCNEPIHQIQVQRPAVVLDEVTAADEMEAIFLFEFFG